MAKQTFINLPKDKKDAVYAALKQEFETYPLYKASVANIVKLAGISRGSFYQYFEDLEDAFFTVMEIHVLDIHDSFIDIVKENEGDLFKALSIYGNVLANKMFEENYYNLFKNMYMYWNADLEIKLRKYRGINEKNYAKHDMFREMEGLFDQVETMVYINSIIQTLVQGIFVNEWTKNMFMKQYGLYMHWVEYGLKYAK